LQLLANSCLPWQIFNFSSNLSIRCNETAEEFTSFAEMYKNARKIANKLMTIASGEINLQSRHDLICHVVKMEAARKYILHTNKENNIHDIVPVLMFQQLLANKHQCYFDESILNSCWTRWSKIS